uniref:Nuclear transport factor 2 like export factor 2 n=4 Tax=Neoaves TaxID=3078114 RepID=A0A663EW35_AQUCH
MYNVDPRPVLTHLRPAAGGGARGKPFGAAPRAAGSGGPERGAHPAPSRRPRASPPFPMAASVDFKTYVDQACRAADEFVNIYYETMDKRRRALTRLYLDKATLVWNGNAVSGQEELNKFFEMLPSSEFQVNMLDCQPVHEQATQGQTTVLVVTSGTVKFDGDKQRYFNQNFLLTAQATPTNTVWKIASDCFRFQDWAS